jgi:predicted dithiol-disulfide oxidoreductase (DUF899 family)
MKITHTASRAALASCLSIYGFLDLTPRGRQRYVNEWPWYDTYGVSGHDEHHHR